MPRGQKLYVTNTNFYDSRTDPRNIFPHLTFPRQKKGKTNIDCIKQLILII